ncbi:MAG: family 78 glycoside hydrolase catalytic domain [Bacteroidota bacterium]
MKKLFFILEGIIFLFYARSEAGIFPTGLKCENLDNPQVIDIVKPHLSWVNIAGQAERGQVQTAWEIRVAGTKEKLLRGQADLWASGKVNTSQSVNVIYEGKALTSRQDCWWQVRTWDKNAKVSEWSEPAFWSMGLLNPSEWKAKWIGAPWQGEEPIPDPVRGENRQMMLKELPPPAPLLRKKINISKEIKDARAFVTGLGYFEFYVNGEKVSDDVLVPNQTNYGKRPGLEKAGIPLPDDFREYRVMYLSYDISGLLKKGENVLGAIVGNGFYNAPMNWTQSYGTPRFISQIYLTYTDGTEDIIVTDESWKASKSPIVMDLIYQGEHYDARLEQPGWNAPGFDDSKWENAVLKKKPEGLMKAHMSPPDKVMEQLKPVTIIKNSDGKYYVDFGQEISGWIRISGVQGDAGRVIDFDYICESTNGDNTYTLKGGGNESYAARFTWFVFRQVVVSNWPGNLSTDQITAEAVYTSVETTGKFETSNPLFNAINKIWWRSQTDNMHGGIASDCPHRERSPYTGDGQVACVTVMHNFDSRAFYTKWIQDIVGAQIEETGYIPNGAPWQPGCGGGVAWGAAVNIMPWEYFVHYGDTGLLAYAYDAMKGYVKYMLTWTDKDGIMNSQREGNNDQPLRWFNLGDWCAPADLPPDIMVHTFYLWRCVDFTSKAAKVLGHTSDAVEYSALSERTKQAFQKKFFDQEKGTYGPGGGNIFALVMGVPADQKQRVIDALKKDITSDKGHLDTGIFGTQFFFEVLADNGMQELAYEAMNKRTQPSYGWWIEQGATTSWEQWDGSGSRNHPMFGGGIVWFYRKLAGMNTDPENPGYRNIIFRPQPAVDLKYASYSNLTPYGTVGIRWEKKDDNFIMDLKVPVGSTATVYVPAGSISQIMENRSVIKKNNKNIKFTGMEDNYAVFRVNSGSYLFSSGMYKY